jgi:hypothetical protein
MKSANISASVESMEEAHLCLAQDGLTSLQIIFNLFRQKPIDSELRQRLLPLIAVCVYFARILPDSGKRGCMENNELSAVTLGQRKGITDAIF